MRPETLEHLSLQIEHLMQLSDGLQAENTVLREKIGVQVKKQARLQMKHGVVAKQIKQALKQMKEALS